MHSSADASGSGAPKKEPLGLGHRPCDHGDGKNMLEMSFSWNP